MMKKEFKIVLDPPPSLNKARIAQRLKKGARIKDSPDLRTWKEYAKIELLSQIQNIPEWIREHAQNIGVFKFEVNWFGDHFFKNGKPKIKDIDNRAKFLADIIFNHIEENDCYIFNFNLIKIQVDDLKEEKCLCVLSPTELIRKDISSLPQIF